MPKDLLFNNRVIGQMPTSWAKVKIDQNLVDILGGFSCPKSRAIASGLPHFRPFNITTEGEVVYSPDTVHIPNDYQTAVDRYFLLEGDVLFNNTNSVELVGKTGIVRQPMQVAFSNHINRLRVRNREQIDPKWLALFLRDLQSRGFFAANCNKWIGQAGFSVDSLSEVDIPLPKIEIQRQIVARIEALLSEVQEMREINQRIYVDTGLIIDSMVQDFLFDGNSPRWKEEKVEDLKIFGPDNGIFLKKDKFGRGVPLINVLDLYKSNTVNPSDLERVEIDLNKTKRFIVEPEDVLINRSSLKLEGLGRSVVFKGADEFIVFECHIMRIRFDPKVLNPYLFVLFMNSKLGKQQIRRKAKMGTMTTWNQQDLQAIKIPKPPIGLQNQFVSKLINMEAEVDDMLATSLDTGSKISQMEHSILASAFRGDLI